MNTKLTLTIDDSIIERAKAYAKDKGRSLSDLIVKSLKGSFKAPDGFDYKKELVKGLSEKYL